MKRKTPEQIFMERSRTIYRHMGERAGKIALRPGFDLAAFRSWLLEHFGTPSGVARCFYSGHILIAENFQVDHQTPISRGGSFDLDNLALCTEQENLRKGNMTVTEYRRFVAHVENYEPEVKSAIWRRLQVGDVQRFSHFRRMRKKKV